MEIHTKEDLMLAFDKELEFQDKVTQLSMKYRDLQEEISLKTNDLSALQLNIAEERNKLVKEWHILAVQVTTFIHEKLQLKVDET